MSWFLVAVGAYLFLAVANLLDKFLVDNVVKSSQAYAFIACILSLVVFLAAPWFLSWPGFFWLLINLAVGFIFAVALWLLYESLRRDEASRILVFIGGITPIFSVILSMVFFKESYSINQWAGIITLLVGIFIIAFLPQPRSFLSRVLSKLKLTQNIKKGGLFIAFLSALAYSFYFIGSKYTYSVQPFASAFIWARLGSALFVLLFLIKKSNRQAIVANFKKSNPNKNKFLVIFNQGLGSTGFILQNYAIFLGSVALVNALQGVQYAFLLIISAILAVLSPKLLKETFSWRIIFQKLVAIVIIGFGLYFLAI